MTGKQVKELAYTREKRRHRMSPSTLLKVLRKRARMKNRAIERQFILKQKGEL